MDFESIDWIVVVIYFVIILFIGFYIARKKEETGASTADEFLLAGRKVTLPLFVGTLVATWYGNILGVGEFVYTSGLVAWVCFGLPYYIAAAIFAIFIAKKIRTANVRTIPEQLASKYGNKAGWIASLIVLIITIPAAYILMLGVLIELFSGWALWVSIIAGAVISLVYIYTGGFRADILTNSAQFVMMYLGFGVLLYFCIVEYGMPGENYSLLPKDHLKFFGGFSWQVILSWYIISFATFIDPSFHQRCAAAKSPSTAQKGILISICCWMVFDTLTLFTGFYAKMFFQPESPVMAYPVLGNAVLPVFWKGLFVVALIAAVMSTLDSYSFISAATIGHDVIKPILKLKNKGADISTKALTRFGLVFTGVLGIVMAIALPSAVQLIYKTASIAVPGLLIPLLLSYSEKKYLSNRQLIGIMLSATILATIWTAGNIAGKKIDFPFSTIFVNIEPMIPGILLSVILASIFFKKNRSTKFLNI